MRLRELTVETFRNHTNTILYCAEKGNVFVGNNGEGKTNLLEAISYLCLTKSFASANDAAVTQFGATKFLLRGTMISDYGTEYVLTVDYNKETGVKTYSINKTRAEQTSKIIGQFPVVIISPEHSAITFGGPQERRTFVDIALSQTNRMYLEQLQEYRRILRQRNKLLLQARETGERVELLLEPWNESFVRSGAALIRKRVEFVKEFAEYVKKAIQYLTGGKETPRLFYEATVPLSDDPTQEEIEVLFAKEIHRRAREEMKTGYSLVGPHRDEFRFHINGLDVRTYASQGQHKTFLVALKMAECEYIRERRKENPILLLDDVLSELDRERSERLLSYVSDAGQCFITSTEREFFYDYSRTKTHWQIFEIEQGTISNAFPKKAIN